MLSKGQSYFFYWVYPTNLCNLSFCIPYKYDEKSESLQLLGSRSNRVYKVTLLSNVAYLFLMCAHLLLNRDKITLQNMLVGAVIIFAYFTAGVCRLTFFLWEDDGLCLLNGFLQFETNLLGNVDNLCDKIRNGVTYAKVVFVLANASCMSMGILVGVQLYFAPCTPPYLGSMRSACLNQESPGPIDFLGMIGILIDAGMYFHAAPPAGLILASYLLCMGISLQEYLSVMSGKLMLHNDVFSTQGQSETRAITSLRKYNACRLLVAQMNIMFRNVFIPGLYCVASNGIVFALYVIIRLHEEISLAGLSFFIMMLMDFLLTVGVDLASVGRVYSVSVEVTETWRKMENLGRKSEARKIAKSFPPLKIRFGDNFVDHLTSLSVLDYCLNWTVSLLLMT
ncbi:uncharacterized protein LOC110857362 isoform X1 [Folsomia candida]|uniref:Odorant receptor n=1 Tax=Folsomia candida TaxID=158441 RepID=A0A226DI14_FOLCA|nr:uncharacterized protein LOC110857362 isoform X1 [Folsomia candida]OXA44883.1 hypothetical protein Fcan01_20126 [Folsomia candida]